MEKWFIGIIGLLVGVLGIGFGSLMGIYIKKTDKVLSFFLGLTGGFIMFIVSFHLFPEAFYIGGFFNVALGVAIGVTSILLIESLLNSVSNFKNIKTGLILGISVAMHSFPEGLALGSSMVGMSDFGFVLVLAMLVHNIPEGISLSIPLSMNKIKPWKILLFSFFVSLPSGIGAYIGAYLGSVSSQMIALCLSAAGGIMLYIVCDELIPSGKSIFVGKISSIAVIIGFLLGIFLYF